MSIPEINKDATYEVNGHKLTYDEYWEYRNKLDYPKLLYVLADEQLKSPIQIAEENGYITIAELAELAGVSIQAIYQRIKKNIVLSAYVHTFEGNKLIHKDAIKFFTRKSRNTKEENDFKAAKINEENLKELEQYKELVKQAALAIEKLKAENKTLQDRITLKNAEIASLQKKIEALNFRERELVDKLLESHSKQNELIEQQHHLMAAQLAKLNPSTEVVEPEAQVIEVYQPKKSFFARLFNK